MGVVLGEVVAFLRVLRAAGRGWEWGEEGKGVGKEGKKVEGRGKGGRGTTATRTLLRDRSCAGDSSRTTRFLSSGRERKS